MGLEDIEKKLYRNEDRAKLDAERIHETPYSIYGDKNTQKSSGYEHFEQADIPFFQKHKKKIIRGLLIALGIALLVALVGGIYELNQRRFSQERVEITIEGTGEVDAGSEVEYVIRYKNRNFAELRNVRVSVQLPSALIDSTVSLLDQERSEVREFDLPDLGRNDEGEIRITGRLIAEQGSVHFVRATLSYVPSVVTSTFETQQEFSTTIVETPIIIDVQTPLESAAGDTVEYGITVNNRGNTDLNNLELNLEYPEGFAFTGASKEPLRDSNVFLIGRLRPRETFELTVSGNLAGEAGQSKVLRVQVGEVSGESFTLYADGQNSTRLAAPFVDISQEIVGNPNRVVSAGDVLEYVVRFRNNTQVRIGQGSLRVQLNGRLFDLSRMDASGADFDAASGTLTWRASAVPQLRAFAPNEQGEVRFRVPVVNRVPIDTFADVDYTLETQAFFESDEIPTPLGINRIVQGNSTEAKLATRLLVSQNVSYDGSGSSITNSGPLPMKVGERTTFTLSWEVQNLTSDASGVTLTSNLPANVTWTGSSNTGGIGEITYNERTKEVRWEIGDVPANTGILRPTYRAVFQVAIVPAPNQVGREPEMLSRTTFTGTDTFTETDLGGTRQPLTTGDISDGAGRDRAIVEQ